MRRWIAALFLALTVFYMGTASVDQCDNTKSDCVQICHIVCADGCAVAPLPATPTPPLPDTFPRAPFELERVVALISLDIEPEKDPPKA